MLQVVVSVSGGVAEVGACPSNVNVEIHDYDNGKEFPGIGEEGVTAKGKGVFEFEGQTYEEDDEGNWYSQS